MASVKVNSRETGILNSKDESNLVDRVINVFREKFHKSKNLRIAGILSYKTDENPDNFIKIEYGLHDSIVQPDENNLPDDSESDLNGECDGRTLLIQNPSPVISPTTTPSITLACPSGDRSDLSECEITVPIRTNDLACENRRDRRKSRRPKRQLIGQDEDSDHVDCDKITTTEPSPKRGRSFVDDSGIAHVGTEHESFSESSVTHADPVSTATSVPNNPPTLETFIQRSVIPENISTTPTQKFTISSRSFSLNELGDLCNLIPLKSLLSQTSQTTGECFNQSKITHYNQNVNQSVILANADSTAPINSTILSTAGPSLSACGAHSNPSIHPNLAAAVVSALTGSNHSQSCCPENILPSNASNLTAPSIALTGPSGEILGTIPLNGFSLAQNSYNVPINPTASISSLNVLRSGADKTHVNMNETIVSPPSLPPSVGSQHSFISSTVNQQQHLTNDCSISGPTISEQALNVLGSIAPTINNSSLNNNNTFMTTAAGGRLLPLLTSLTNSTNTGTPACNSAALIAALIKGLTNVRQCSPNSTEIIGVENSNDCNQTPTQPIGIDVSGPSVVFANSSSATTALGQLGTILQAKSLNLTGSTVLNAVGNEQLGSLVTNVLNKASPAVSCAATPASRNSILLSCPRAVGEMNLLVAPSPNLSSITNLPSALPIQNLSNVNITGINLGSPIIVHTPINAQALSKIPTLVSATNTITSTTVASSVGQPSSEKSSNFNASNRNLCADQVNGEDPTSSAIDRILQTIRGCMKNNENRENHSTMKPTVLSSTKIDIPLVQLQNAKSVQCSQPHSIPTDTKRTISVQFAPVTLCVNKNAENILKSDELNKLPLERLTHNTNTKENDVLDVQTEIISKVYRCRYCGKTFNRKFCRERHERLHTGVKPYSCEICDEKFIRLEDKKRHVRSLQHYLSRCAAYVRSASDEFHDDEPPNAEAERALILPLLAHTLQNDTQNQTLIQKLPDELDMIDTSDAASNDPGSECDSTDTQDTREKTFITERKLLIDTSDSSVDARSLIVSKDDVVISEQSPEVSSCMKLRVNTVMSPCRSALRETQPNTLPISIEASTTVSPLFSTNSDSVQPLFSQ